MDPAQILEDRCLQCNIQLYTNTSTKHDDSQIQQFYDGATVFITGGTGFMGKHLIEKLLRATNVSKIFILMRPKKGKLLEDRLIEMINDPVYELLREKMPDFQQKLVPIAGDIAEIRLGMSDDDWNVVTHQIYISRDVKLGFIPVDYVNNATIVAGWDTANRSDEKVKIYTVTLSTRNGITYGQKQEIFDKVAHEYPFPDSVWSYFILLTANPILFFIYTWILHMIPAYIVDGILIITRKKRRAVKMARKLSITSKALAYFCTNQWNFEDKNLALLYEKLTPIDKEIFDFDVMKLDWKDYLTIFPMGIRKYILKDGLTRTNYARKNQILFRILMLFVFPFYLYMLFKIIYLSVWGSIYVLI